MTFQFKCYRNESNIYTVREKRFRPQGLQSSVFISGSLFSTHPIFRGNRVPKLCVYEYWGYWMVSNRWATNGQWTHSLTSRPENCSLNLWSLDHSSRISEIPYKAITKLSMSISISQPQQTCGDLPESNRPQVSNSISLWQSLVCVEAWKRSLIETCGEMLCPR